MSFAGFSIIYKNKNIKIYNTFTCIITIIVQIWYHILVIHYEIYIFIYIIEYMILWYLLIIIKFLILLYVKVWYIDIFCDIYKHNIIYLHNKVL